MNEFIDKTYWIAISHLPKWNMERINRLIIQVIHEKKMSWSDFFESGKKGWLEIFALSEKELSDIESAKNELPRLAFIAEQLQNEGFQIIPIDSPDYPVVLKENLKIKSAPPILYVKGRRGLLQEDAVAIVGSGNAGSKTLEFTDHVAKKNVRESKVFTRKLAPSHTSRLTFVLRLLSCDFCLLSSYNPSNRIQHPSFLELVCRSVLI